MDVPTPAMQNENEEAELYRAFMKNDHRKVLRLCRRYEEGPFHVLGIHKDSLLHMALYHMQLELALQLLEEAETQNHINKMRQTNDAGHTILHVAALYDELLPAAKEILLLEPSLLTMRTSNNDTVLYRAARYGQIKMFIFLDEQIQKNVESEEARRAYYERDGNNVLHTAIVAKHFELALWIARKYKYLAASKRKKDGMTALQLLATKQSAFKIRDCVSLKNRLILSVASICKVSWWDTLRTDKETYESAVELAKFLIPGDLSWKESLPWKKIKSEEKQDESKKQTQDEIEESSDEEEEDISDSKKSAQEQEKSKKPAEEQEKGKKPAQEQEKGKKPAQEQDKSKKSTQEEEKSKKLAQEGGKSKEFADKSKQTPLFLATKSGSVEIVKEILNTYPQAVEHVDSKGRTILHIAVKYDQIEIFDIVEKMKLPMRRLIKKVDKDSNSILHMVGEQRYNMKKDTARVPIVILHEKLLLLKRLKDISEEHFYKNFNKEGKTAENVFEDNNETLRGIAEEWLRRTVENFSIVAVFIATVAFAAAYTVPGGPDQQTGRPILLTNTFFVIFTVSDILSITFTLTAVIIFASILTSPFRIKDFKRSLPQKLMVGLLCLIFSVTMMMLAFAATIMLMISNKQPWTKNILYPVSLLPVTVLAFQCFSLFWYLIQTCPRLPRLGVRSFVSKLINFRKFQTRSPSNPTSPRTIQITNSPPV